MASMSLINTLVFLDLETTGLPETSIQGPKSVRCTEVSLVAVHRTHFNDHSFDFRVLNRLNLCINPRNFISAKATELTGLTNNNLDTQHSFSPATGRLLCQFLEELDEPMCLLAHNGLKFDFPLLKAQMTKVGETLPNNILYLDTYHAILELDSNPKISCATFQLNDPSTIAKILDNGRVPREVGETTPTRKRKYPVYSPVYKNPREESTHTPIKTTQVLPSIADTHIKKENCSVGSDVIEQGQLHEISTPMNYKVYSTGDKLQSSNRNSAISEAVTTIVTNQSSMIEDPIPLTPVKYPVYSPVNKKPFANGKSAKRSLFSTSQVDQNVVDSQGSDEDPFPRISVTSNLPENPASTVNNHSARKQFRKGYKLTELHERILGMPLPDAHTAEADAIGLMRVCHRIENFAQWMDKHAEPFSEIKSLF